MNTKDISCSTVRPQDVCKLDLVSGMLPILVGSAPIADNSDRVDRLSRMRRAPYALASRQPWASCVNFMINVGAQS